MYTVYVVHVEMHDVVHILYTVEVTGLYCRVVQEDQSTDSALKAIGNYRVNTSTEYDPVVNNAIDEIQRDVSLITLLSYNNCPSS